MGGSHLTIPLAIKQHLCKDNTDYKDECVLSLAADDEGAEKAPKCDLWNGELLRGTATFLSTDIEGSTKLAQQYHAFHHRSPGPASRHSLADDKGPLAPDSQQRVRSRTELSRAGLDGVLLAIELAVAYPGAAFRRAASGMWSVVAGPIHDAHSAAHEAGFSPVPHTEVPLLRLASSVL